jgi:hypothetical protein
MKEISRILLFTILFFSILTNSFAQKKSRIFKDSLDGAFDISKYLFDLHGFLPVVSIITEPALGYGGACVGVYFIPKKKTLQSNLIT